MVFKSNFSHYCYLLILFSFDIQKYVLYISDCSNNTIKSHFIHCTTLSLSTPLLPSISLCEHDILPWNVFKYFDILPFLTSRAEMICDRWRRALSDEFPPTPRAPLSSSVCSLRSFLLCLSLLSCVVACLFPQLPQVHPSSVINTQKGDSIKKLRQEHVAVTLSRSGLMVREHLHSQCQWLVTEAA